MDMCAQVHAFLNVLLLAVLSQPNEVLLIIYASVQISLVHVDKSMF